MALCLRASAPCRQKKLTPLLSARVAAVVASMDRAAAAPPDVSFLAPELLTATWPVLLLLLLLVLLPVLLLTM
jgi:hypothetical protein